MRAVGLFEAKTKLSELCDRVARRGETIVITKRGRAVARLVGVDPSGETLSVWERRERFLEREKLPADFEAPPRRKDATRSWLD